MAGGKASLFSNIFLIFLRLCNLSWAVLAALYFSIYIAQLTKQLFLTDINPELINAIPVLRITLSQ